jgi:hypothetical protein
MDELVAALLASVSIAAAVRDGLAFLLANAQRSNPKTRPQDRPPPERLARRRRALLSDHL